MELKIVQESDTLTWLALVGMLDMLGTQTVENAFVAHTTARGKPVIVDLAEVSFISSLAMGMFINCQKALKRKRAPLVLLRPQPLVRDALQRVRMHELVHMVDTEAEAQQLAVVTPA